MEDGTKSKKTVFVGGLGEDIDEAIIYETFSTFGMCFRYTGLHAITPSPFCTGDILDVQLPSAVVDPNRQNGQWDTIAFITPHLMPLRAKTPWLRICYVRIPC